MQNFYFSQTGLCLSIQRLSLLTFC